MIKLTYTNEMVEQDKLWESENENLEIMMQLHMQIINEAKQKGFKGITVTEQYSNEVCTTVYSSLEEQEKAQNDEIEILSVGYCKPLIEALEFELNNKKGGI